jgi:hypothetical protein
MSSLEQGAPKTHAAAGFFRRCLGFLAIHGQTSRAREIRSGIYKTILALLGFTFIAVQSYRTEVASWLQITNATTAAVAAYTEQALQTSALVLKNVADAIVDMGIETPVSAGEKIPH